PSGGEGAGGGFAVAAGTSCGVFGQLGGAAMELRECEASGGAENGDAAPVGAHGTHVGPVEHDFTAQGGAMLHLAMIPTGIGEKTGHADANRTGGQTDDGKIG